MKLEIGYSPCPNDTFIFDAMVHGKIDTEGLLFQPILLDVEELNHRAFAKTYPITKLSYHALAYVQDRYQLLESGSALGEGIGPLLISLPLSRKLSSDSAIAIPGKYTTAAFLFKLAYPAFTNLVPMVFDEIEEAIKTGQVDAGVIIHENRFTYAARGFELIQDLGTYWETETNLPIPLGGIAVRRDLSDNIKHAVQRVLKASIEFAFANPAASASYVAANAQEMSAEVQAKHIKTYVNDYSLSLGERGRAAVAGLFNAAYQKGLVDQPSEPLMLKPSK